MAFFTCGHLKKMSNQRHILVLLSWMGGGYSKKIDEDGIQTENFIGG